MHKTAPDETQLRALAEEFFADLEDNGFMPLTVKAPAQAALHNIAQSLA